MTTRGACIGASPRRILEAGRHGNAVSNLINPITTMATLPQQRQLMGIPLLLGWNFGRQHALATSRQVKAFHQAIICPGVSGDLLIAFECPLEGKRSYERGTVATTDVSVETSRLWNTCECA